MGKPAIVPPVPAPAGEDLATISVLAEDVRRKTAELDEAKARLEEAVTSHRQKLNAILGVADKEKIPRGERMAKVRDLMAEGRSPDEIAKEIGYPTGVVQRLIGKIRAKDEERAAGTTGTPRPPQPPPPPPPTQPPQRLPIRAADAKEGPTLNELKDITKKVFKTATHDASLMTSMYSGHAHVAKINMEGMGHTTAGKDGHTHSVFNFVVGPGSGPDAHSHQLLTIPASDK